MKKLFVTILSYSLFLNANLSAQWEILNEGFKGNLNTIDFVNDNVGWIAGSNGTLFKTTDGGKNWITISINENWHISQIDFINESVGWGIGGVGNWWQFDSHLVLKTTNGGLSWAQQFTSTSIGFKSLHVINETNVYAVGGDKIYKTTNGGINWINISTNLPNRNYNSVWFQDSQIGVVVGNYNDGTADRGIICRTTNGGTSWNENMVNEFNSIYELQFLDNANGYFRANLDTTHFICKTEDLCASWTIKIQHPYPITSYQFLDNSIIYAIMGDSIASYNIMLSIDSGLSWQRSQSIPFFTNKIYINVNGVGFVLSNYARRGGWRGVLYKGFNGKNWLIQKFYYPYLQNIHFVTENVGFISGGYQSAAHSDPEGRIFSSSDGGKTWNNSFDSTGWGGRFVFLNEYEGYTLFGSAIYKTSDNGNAWTQVYKNNPDSIGYSFFWNDIYFVDEIKGFVVGRYEDSLSHGAGVLVTTDAGESWDLGWQHPDSNDIWHNLNSITSIGNTGWAVGESGLIVKHTPQTGWVKQNSITDLPLNKVFFRDENSGWITGGYLYDNDNQKILLKTIDAGVSWNAVPNVPFVIKDIWFINNNLGLAIGYDSSGVGGILKSTDGGNTWTIDTGNLSAKLNALYIKDGYGWAVGDDGLILRTTNAGPTWVDDENRTLPKEFVLEQNYPNPFSAKGGSASGGNPSTKIRYTIPTPPSSSPLIKGRNENLSRNAFGMGFVTLKVYDVLGREVATLVNEEKPPGVYEVEFTGHSDEGWNLSSGIYLYRLIAGNFIAVRKAILLK